MEIMSGLQDKTLFSKTEQEIVNYILRHPHEVTQMTLADLAEETYSSNPVIVRICKKLGFKGFKEFRIEYARAIEASKYVDLDIDYSQPFTKDGTTAEIVKSLSSLYKGTIDLVNSSLNYTVLEKVAAVLDSSERVFIYAHGDSNTTAANFSKKVLKIGKLFLVPHSLDEEIYYVKNANPDDCIVFLTYQSPDHFIQYFKQAKRNRCRTVTISSVSNHLLATSSEYFIRIPQNESPDKIATFYSQHAFTYVLSILYSLLYNMM